MNDAILLPYSRIAAHARADGVASGYAASTRREGGRHITASTTPMGCCVQNRELAVSTGDGRLERATSQRPLSPDANATDATAMQHHIRTAQLEDTSYVLFCPPICNICLIIGTPDVLNLAVSKQQ